ncbi:MAG: glycosyltransferase family 39 protein, partial [Planctomycetota bacterium]
FGTSALAILALFASLSAAVATVVFAATREDCGLVPAALAGALLLLLPLTQEFGHMVMTEMPQALWCTLAVLQFGRFLDEERARSALGFAFFSVLAILTKGNGIFLALVPPLAIGLSGRWHLLKRPALWLSGLAVGVCCAPWYWFTLNISRTTWGAGASPTWEYSKQALEFYGEQLWWLAGVTAGAVAILGLALRLIDTNGARAGRWAAMIAWLPALMACNVILPTGVDARHLLLIAPVWVAGWAAGAASIGAGLEWLGGARGSATRRTGGALVAIALLAVFCGERFERPRKDYRGFRAAAQTLQGDQSLSQSVFLVASDSKGEGLFVTAVALGEERPGHVVLRASQVLSSSDWMGEGYQLQYTDTDSLAAFLQDLPVGIVAFDASTPPNHWTAHHDLLLETLVDRPQAWVELAPQEVVRDGQVHPAGLRLFRLVGHEGRRAALPDLEKLLGRKLPGF